MPGIFRETVGMGLMVQMGHDGVSSLSRAAAVGGPITLKTEVASEELQFVNVVRNL